MPHRGETRHPFRERGYKTGVFDEIRREIEKIDVFSGLDVLADGSAAESVDFRRNRGIYHWEHSFIGATGLP
jgi:hypothetical protein